MKLNRSLTFITMFMILALVVAACGGDDDNQAGSGSGDQSSAATPKAEPTEAPKVEPRYGGTVVLGSQTTNAASGLITPYSVRPAARQSSLTISNNVYSNLMILDPFQDHKAFEGHLATEWSVSNDGLTTTVRLREGVEFHDGVEFTAKDVVHTVNLMAAPPDGWRSDLAGLLGSRGSETTAVDDHTVTFSHPQVSAFFPLLLTDYRFQIMPSHITDLEALAVNPVGTGAWKHDNTTQDVETVLAKNSNYFRTDPEGRALPFLDGLSWTQFTGTELWLAALKTGQTQMVDHFHGPQLGPAEVRADLAAAVPGIVFDQYIQTQYGFIFGNVEPFDDPGVREAIFLWLDRKEIFELDTAVGSVYGSGVIPADLGGKWALPEEEIYAWPGLRYVAAAGNVVLSSADWEAKRNELAKHPADLARAKELLGEAGIAPGSFKTTLLVQGGGVQDRVGPVVVQQLSSLFESEWELKISTDASAYWVTGIFAGDWQNIAWGNHGAAGIDDPQRLTEDGGWVSTSFWYQGGFDPNPAIDALYAEQDTLLDGAARLQTIQELQREVLKHHVRIIGHLPKSPGAHHPEIMDRPGGGDTPGTTNGTNNWMYDRMWINK